MLIFYIDIYASVLFQFSVENYRQLSFDSTKCLSGRNRVWCLYPNKNTVTESVKDVVGCLANPESRVGVVIYMPHYCSLSLIMLYLFTNLAH